MMSHKGCGGEIGKYPDGWVEEHPAIVCRKCNRELGCDDEIELEGEDKELVL